MESRAIALLKEAGQKGLLLSELVQKLDQSASDVRNLVESLKRQGHVREVEAQHNGASAIRLIWQRGESPEWNTLKGCPCFACKEIEQCGEGQPITPWYCGKLNTWLAERLNPT
jgi:hypothetical protein